MTVPPSLGGPTGAADSRRLVAEAAAAALLVAVLHVLLRLSSGFLIGALNDDGVYVVLGRAIAEGEGYRSLHLVGAPVQLRYPPGFPLLLAIPWALGGTLGAVQATVGVLNLLATATGAGLVWWIGRRRLGVSPWPLAVLAVAPFLIDPTIQYFNIPLTEPYFVLGWAGALALGYPLFEPAAPPTARRVGQAVVVGLVLAAATLFRTAAVALLPAMLLALLIHRRWKEATACGAALAVPLLVWARLQALWAARGPTSAYPDDLGYWRWLGVEGPFAFVGYAARTIAANAIEYVGKLASYLFSSQPLGIVVVAVGALAVGVACVRDWRSHTALVLTTLAAAGLTLVWPFAQGRLLLPLLPFFGLLAASSVELLTRRTRERFRWGLAVALGCASLAVGLRQRELREVARQVLQSGVTPAPQDLSPTLTLAARSRFIYLTITWIQGHTGPDAPIMVDAPSSVYLYSGRPAIAGLPTESRLGTSVFDTPGAYLARRILEDSVAVIVFAPPADALERDILRVIELCPHVLRREPPVFPAFFRVAQRDATCLGQLTASSVGR